MQQILLIFWKIPSCTALFHPARLLNLGNFEPECEFSIMKNEIFHPALIPSCTFIPSCMIIRETRVWLAWFLTFLILSLLIRFIRHFFEDKITYGHDIIHPTKEVIALSKYQWVGYSRVTYSHFHIDFTGSFFISSFAL